MGKVVKILSIVAAVALAIPSGGTSLLAATLGVSALAATAITVGLTVGASLLAKRPKAPTIPRESLDRLNASINPREPRKGWFGATAGNSDIRDQEYTGSQTYLDRFIVSAAHKIQSFDEVWFDDKLAWTSAGGAQGEYAGYLTITPITEGNSGNAINIGARMGTTRRYTGCAYLHLKYRLTGLTKKTESPFAQGIPTRITIRGKGALTYDPRLDSTVAGGSGSHRPNNQSTWAWNANASRNPAILLLWYLLGWRINGVLSVGCGLPPERIDLESFAIAANLCDEAVALAAGGTEPRYRADGVFSEGQSPTEVMDNLKAAMNADLDDVGGKLRLTVFHNDLADPVADFGDDDMVEGFDWEPTAELSDSFNVVRGSYVDASNTALYQLVDYPQVEIASLDGIERADQFNLAYVQSPSQAQRLAKQRLQRQQYGGEFSTVLNARGWKVQKNSVVTLSFTRLGWTNKLFRVAEMEHRVDGTCPIVLREESEDIYAWDEDESPAVEPADPTVYDYTKSPIYLGFDDIDQSGTKVVWKRSATQPATPADSPGTPATWYDDVASVPAGANPLWAMQGQRGDVTLDYVWDTPYQAEGIDGTSPPLIFVASTHQTFRYDTAGSPLSQTTTITATRQNTAGTTEWRLLKADGTALTGWLTAAAMVTNGGANSSPNNDTLVIDQTQFAALLAFASTAGLIYEARMSGATSVQDRISIVRVQDGAEGAAPFALAAYDANSQVSGNRLIKVAGATGWNASTHSTNSFKGGASVSFVIDTAASFMVGLNTDPTADADYTSLDFAIYIAGPTTLQVYESGVPAYSNTSATNNVGDVYTVTYNGKSVVYSRNGVAFHTNNAPAPNLTLFVDSSFYTAAPVTFGRIMSFTGVGIPGTDGTNGTNGTNGLSIAASKPILTVARTGSGTVKSGELPKSTQMIVYDGFTDVTSSCTYSRTVHNCSVSNDGGGQFTLTSVSAVDAYFDVTATYGSRSISMRIPTSQAADGPAASRVSAALASMSTSGTFTSIGFVDIVAAAGTTISGAASTTYQATNTGSGTRLVRAEAKISIQNLTDSGSESDGTAQIGSAASYISGDGPSDIGSVSAGHSVTNSTGAPKTFRIRFYIRKYDGLANINTTGGTYAGTVAAEVA